MVQMRVTKSVFAGSGREGDFSWMIKQPQYARTLFVFNDNETQFRAFHAGKDSGLTMGGGNAVIRPYQGHSPQRAAGIPTGDHSNRGYESLTAEVKAVIDKALDHIARLLATGAYDEVVFSYNPTTETLGSKLFAPAREVADYIMNGLLALETR